MKNFTVVTVIVAMVVGTSGMAQNVGTNSTSLAGIVSVLPHDPWALFHNPGALGDSFSVVFTSFLSNGEFGLHELRRVSASFILPLDGAGVGIGADQFGFDLYKESSLVAGFGLALDGGWSGGISMQLRQLDIKGYGTDRSVLIHAGGLVRIARMVTLGASASNITGSTIGTIKERLPQTLALGLRFEPSGSFFAAGEIEKDVRYPAAVKVAVCQSLGSFVGISAGLADHPSRVSAGIDVRYRGIICSWAGYRHEDLGWTHHVGITVELSK